MLYLRLYKTHIVLGIYVCSTRYQHIYDFQISIQCCQVQRSLALLEEREEEEAEEGRACHIM